MKPLLPHDGQSRIARMWSIGASLLDSDRLPDVRGSWPGRFELGVPWWPRHSDQSGHRSIRAGNPAHHGCPL